MPTHARPALLRRALHSLREQTFQDFEVIVIDDLGEAATAAVASELLAAHDTFLRRPGKPGAALSRNAGMAMARGQWLIFLDDDDRFAPHHLATVHGRAQALDAQVLYGDCDVVTEDRSKDGVPELSRQHVDLKPFPIQSLWVKNFIPLHALAYRRCVLEGLTTDPFMASLEDWEFLLAVAERVLPEHYPGGGAIQHVDQVNPGIRRSTTVGAKNSLVVLDYLYTYRRRPAPNDAIRAQRRALLKSVGLEFPTEWF